MCNTNNTQPGSEINHVTTLRFLKKQGYPKKVIRQVLPLLAGVPQSKMAEDLGEPQASISQHINMFKYRRKAELQAGIAELLGVPKEEFFEED